MIDLTLYHNLASASSQKVRLTLAEKKLDFQSVEISLGGEQHAPGYRAVNPAGVMPTLVHRGDRMFETAAILEYLDEVFPSPPLSPSDPVLRQRMRAHICRLNEVNHPANGMMHYAILARPALLHLPSDRLEALLAAMPNERDRKLRRAAVSQGLKAPEFADAVRTQEQMLDTFEEMLGRTFYLINDDVTLLDLTALPYVARLDQMGFTKLITNCERPHLAAWYERMKLRPSWEASFAFLAAGAFKDWPTMGRAAMPSIRPLLRRPPKNH
jgi:glutathione S-transferase